MRAVLPRALACAWFLTFVACGGGDTPSDGSGAPLDAVEAAPQARRSFERSIVFVSTGSGPRIVVPWLLESVTRPGGLDRIYRGFLLRDGEWEPFYRSAWSTGPQREPWQIVPEGPFRILVGDGGRLDRVVFDGGGRQLQLTLEEGMVEWTGSQGGSFGLLEGGLTLGDRRVPGWVLDVSQGVSLEEGTLGDWLFLTAGDDLAVVVEAPVDSGGDVRYQGWARRDGDEARWPLVDVEWETTQAYDPARREIPSVLVLATPDEGLTGRLTVRSLQLEARDGAGPVLPVDGLLEVEGRLELDGSGVDVRGLLRHRARRMPRE